MTRWRKPPANGCFQFAHVWPWLERQLRAAGFMNAAQELGGIVTLKWQTAGQQAIKQNPQSPEIVTG